MQSPFVYHSCQSFPGQIFTTHVLRTSSLCVLLLMVRDGHVPVLAFVKGVWDLSPTLCLGLLCGGTHPTTLYMDCCDSAVAFYSPAGSQSTVRA